MKTALMMQSLLALLCLISGMALAADTFLTTPLGARYKDLRTGIGESAAVGDVVSIHFVGWLDDSGRKGKEIYNSRRWRDPVAFVIGTDKVMQGWNEGVTGMRPGGRRLLMLPPALGYGARSVDDIIPANARLIFVIELLELQKRTPQP
ncbi:MAG: FKBP-type peptidyl-prolyl cis-trans isomerase [Gammaproteobacteria bacterium]|nr:FKBP-type peptidyl-prolyl cis-trans isomerase [Gammaproteobacteria bacterium]